MTTKIKHKTTAINTAGLDKLKPKHQEQIFTDGSVYFHHLIKDIRRAQHTVKMEVYNFSYDTLGKQVASALSQAAERGVKVKLLMDGAGTPFWGAPSLTQLKEPV